MQLTKDAKSLLYVSLWEGSGEKQPLIINNCHYLRWKGTDNNQTVILSPAL